VIVSPASFKGTLSARDAARAIAAGVRRAVPDADIVERPVADGGEGSLDALGWPRHAVRVAGLYGEPCVADVGVRGDTWAIELARICGFRPDGDVLRATTRGVGEALRAGFDAGIRRSLVCLGGSGTNDGGSGLITGLGGALLDADGNELPPGPLALSRLARIRFPRVRTLEIDVACDVDAPLLGPSGASMLYGPQKGARDVGALEAAMERWAAVIEEATGVSVAAVPGAGAAGGTGAGLLAIGGRLGRGSERILDALGWDAAGADLVITGEGRFDAQTLQGKAPFAVARRALALGVPVMLFAGSVDAEIPGVTAIAVGPPGLEPAQQLTTAVEDALRGG
jgi:glycerate kinase